MRTNVLRSCNAEYLEVSAMERTLTFELEKDTKNTYRFQEVAKGAPPLIGTLYMQKWAFETAPKTITVTISG